MSDWRKHTHTRSDSIKCMWQIVLPRSGCQSVFCDVQSRHTLRQWAHPRLRILTCWFLSTCPCNEISIGYPAKGTVSVLKRPISQSRRFSQNIWFELLIWGCGCVSPVITGSRRSDSLGGGAKESSLSLLFLSVFHDLIRSSSLKFKIASLVYALAKRVSVCVCSGMLLQSLGPSVFSPKDFIWWEMCVFGSFFWG